MITATPHLALVVVLIVCLYSSSLVSASPDGTDTITDVVDLASGVRQYLELMSASMTKGLGYSSESNVNTFPSGTSLQADTSNRIDANTKEGDEALKQLELQSRYADNDLGEKNLMWSLRGSQSEETLRKNLEDGTSEVPAPIYFRRLAEVAEGWVSRIINAAYSNEGSDNYSQGSFRNISPEVRKTAHQTSIYFKH